MIGIANRCSCRWAKGQILDAGRPFDEVALHQRLLDACFVPGECKTTGQCLGVPGAARRPPIFLIRRTTRTFLLHGEIGCINQGRRARVTCLFSSCMGCRTIVDTLIHFLLVHAIACGIFLCKVLPLFSRFGSRAFVMYRACS